MRRFGSACENCSRYAWLHRCCCQLPRLPSLCHSVAVQSDASIKLVMLTGLESLRYALLSWAPVTQTRILRVVCSGAEGAALLDVFLRPLDSS